MREPASPPPPRLGWGSESPPWIRNTVGALVALLPDAEKQTMVGFAHGAPAPVLAPFLEEFFADGRR